MLDTIVVCAHLALMLTVGLVVSGRCRARTLSEFALGGRNHSNGVLAATFFAAAMGGSATLGNAERAFRVGITYPFVCAVGFAVADLLTAWWFAARLQRFAGCISCGDIMARMYGRWGQIATGVATVLMSLVGVAAQLAALSYIGELLGLSYRWGAFLGIATVVLYSTWGGVRSVAVTDLWQLITMLLAAALLCLFGIVHVGGMAGLTAKVPPQHMQLFPTHDSVWQYGSLLLLFSFPFLSPPKVHRILLAHNSRQAAVCLRISALLKALLLVMTGCIGLIALALSPNIQANAAMPAVVQQLLPVGLRGLAIAGLISAMMSTCDSLLHTAGIALVHDVITPLRRMSLPTQHELLLVRCATVCLAVFCVTQVRQDVNVIDLILRNFSIWWPTLFVPLLFGLWGVQASQTALLCCCVAGAACWLLWPYTTIATQLPLFAALPAMLCNACVFLLVRFVQQHTRGNPAAGTNSLQLSSTQPPEDMR
ncbi:MAG: sodium:solute symporter family protein [Myxococcota bacterium]